MAKHVSTNERLLGRLTYGPGQVEEIQLVAGTGVTLTFDPDTSTITVAATAAASSDDDQGGDVLRAQALG